jgi:hypothetical protein
MCNYFVRIRTKYIIQKHIVLLAIERGLSYGSATVRLLGLRVRMAPGA